MHSSYYLLYHRLRGYDLLKTYGYLFYHFLWPFYHNKLEPLYLPYVFFSYHPSYKGYVCYNNVYKKTYILFHVIFHETMFLYLQSLIPSITSSPSISISTSNEYYVHLHAFKGNDLQVFVFPFEHHPSIPIFTFFTYFSFYFSIYYFSHTFSFTYFFFFLTISSSYIPSYHIYNPFMYKYFLLIFLHLFNHLLLLL